MTIKELMEKRAKVWEGAKEFVDTHEDKNGLLSEADTETYNKMEKDIEDLTKAIERQERADRLEAELSKPVLRRLPENLLPRTQSRKRRASHRMRTRKP